MTSIEKEIEKIEQEIRETPYNKSTEKHIGRLKAKLARLKEEKRKKSEERGGGSGYSIEKSGDATLVLVGFPSVGKSTLLNSLTDAGSKVADYEFTTLQVIPGTLKYKGANVQILDVPGIISGASEGRGRGREVVSVLRNADLLLVMVDVFEPEQYEEVNRELFEAGIRPDESPPDVKIRRRGKGGLEISSTVDLDLSEEEIKSILREYNIVNADVFIRENLDQERLIDAVMDNRVYVPELVLVNKIDLVDGGDLRDVRKKVKSMIDSDCMFISAKEDDLGRLKEKIFEKLDFIRIYLKPKGGEVDRDEPMILKRGVVVEDLCRKIHKDLVSEFRYAKIWGDSAKYPGQQVGKNHELTDEDVVTIIKEK